MEISKRGPHEPARDFALRVLKYNIIRLDLEPGSMVSENELASELGLSRGPVREALIELSKVKIVEVFPQRGSFISLVDYDLVDEARFVRETLEVAVAERCCSTGVSSEHLAMLGENVDLQKFYLKNDNNVKLWELDDQFHSMLFLAAGLSQTHILMKGMQIHFDRIRVMGTTPTAGPRNVEDHRLIFNAVASRDTEKAKNLIRKHLNNYQIDRQAVFERYPQYMKH